MIEKIEIYLENISCPIPFRIVQLSHIISGHIKSTATVFQEPYLSNDTLTSSPEPTSAEDPSSPPYHNNPELRFISGNCY